MKSEILQIGSATFGCSCGSLRLWVAGRFACGCLADGFIGGGE